MNDGEMFQVREALFCNCLLNSGPFLSATTTKFFVFFVFALSLSVCVPPVQTVLLSEHGKTVFFQMFFSRFFGRQYSNMFLEVLKAWSQIHRM